MLPSNKLLTLFKKIARQIRYRPLTELIGKTIQLDGLDQVEGVLLNVLPAGCQLLVDVDHMTASLAKYGLLDLEFSAPAEALSIDSLSGIQVLRANPLLLPIDPEDIIPEDIKDGEVQLAHCLAQLERNKTVAKLFLTSTYPTMTIEEKLRFYKLYHKQLPNDFFPRAFVIKDACITNLASIWFWKHLYL